MIRDLARPARRLLASTLMPVALGLRGAARLAHGAAIAGHRRSGRDLPAVEPEPPRSPGAERDRPTATVTSRPAAGVATSRSNRT